MLMCSWQQSNTAALLHVFFLLNESSPAKLAGHHLQCMRLASMPGEDQKWANE